MHLGKSDIIAPDSQQIQAAQHLYDSLEGKDSAVLLQGNEQSFDIPDFALRLLTDICRELSKGRAVTLCSIPPEVTTSQAADILNVSRPYVEKLLEESKLPSSKVGRHRRIPLQALLSYREKTAEEYELALDELVRFSEELGGYE